MRAARVLVPLPRRDFDPSEAAIPWQILGSRGHDVVFATPDGRVASADEMMLTGRGLDPWGFMPGLDRLVAVGLLLRANRAARAAYAAMIRDQAFEHPLRWSEIASRDFDALLLPGGHRARGMREYLESPLLQALAVEMFRAEKPVGAICHGVLVLARAIDPATGRSVLHGCRTTALTWALEGAARRLTRFTRFWDANYYATFPDRPGERPGTRSTEAEVRRALADPSHFRDVPKGVAHYRLKTDGLHRDSQADDRPAFVVEDDAYVSARWPGDVHTFAKAFAGKVEGAVGQA